MIERVGTVNRFGGRATLPGDKSISHRALIFGALANGVSEFEGVSDAGDVRSTLRCLRQLGVSIRQEGNKTWVEGKGLHGLRKSEAILDCENSGTTFRLLMGILAAQPFSSVMVGDDSLSRRPMNRVAEPLRKMGAAISLHEGNFPPAQITAAKNLIGQSFDLKTASAQIKSALLLAGLFADGKTTVSGRTDSRDHTERLLPAFGVHCVREADKITVSDGMVLTAFRFTIPTDPSAGAAWAAAASLFPGSQVEMEGVSLNPTRLGFYRVLEKMGAQVSMRVRQNEPEPMGTLSVTGKSLTGVSLGKHEIPALIDELPLLAIVATFAHGVTEVRGAAELRVKETDRLATVARNLTAMGGRIKLFPDGFRIEGPQSLTAAVLDSFGDHRIAMAFSIAALKAEGESEIQTAECVHISYPEFFRILRRLVS